MKHLKTYTLFERVSKESLNDDDFPEESLIKDLLIDLYDDEILYRFDSYYYGYIYFMDESLKLIKDTVRALSDKRYDLFFDIEDPKIMSQGQVKLYTSINSILAQNGELIYEEEMPIWENIVNNKIKGYPQVQFYIGHFESKYLDRVLEAFQNIYNATGFRPLGKLSQDDFVDEETGDIANMISMEATLVNVNDKVYKILSNLNMFRSYNPDYGHKISDNLIKQFLN